jgi:hypothetical protein
VCTGMKVHVTQKPRHFFISWTTISFYTSVSYGTVYGELSKLIVEYVLNCIVNLDCRNMNCGMFYVPRIWQLVKKLNSSRCLIKHFIMNIVAYLLKARTVEPGKQPLLANGSETTLVSRQRPHNKERNSGRC